MIRKILLVSDTVMPQMESPANLRRNYHDTDLIISCGDLPVTYLDLISTVTGAPLFYVRGNHDQNYNEDPPGGVDLHGRVVTYAGITMAGLEGSIQYNEGDIQYTQQQMRWTSMRLVPRLMLLRWRRRQRLDILVTHSPAYGIHDGRDLPHQGFRAFNTMISWFRPRYLVHGHVHTWDRRVATRTTIGETLVININPVTVLELALQAESPKA
jgi:uncharacterized protein